MWLLLVGQFEDGDPVTPEVRRVIESDDRIVTVPWLADPRVAYRAMDVLAFPSYREGLPNVPLEAQLCAVPVVAYEATGTVDAVASRCRRRVGPRRWGGGVGVGTRGAGGRSRATGGDGSGGVGMGRRSVRPCCAVGRSGGALPLVVGVGRIGLRVGLSVGLVVDLFDPAALHERGDSVDEIGAVDIDGVDAGVGEPCAQFRK